MKKVLESIKFLYLIENEKTSKSPCFLRVLGKEIPVSSLYIINDNNQ